MSRSQPQITNPCTKFIEISSDDGTFFYYDKEKELKILVPMPVYFAVLDELSTIQGFNKRNKCGVYSNEIHSTVKEVLRVKTFKGGESAIGFYQDIRDTIVAMGGKFAKSVYALLVDPEGGAEFVNFSFKGAAFSAWLDKGFNPMNFIVGVSEFVEEKNGNNTYQVPVFKAFKSNPEIDAAAVEQDKVLQEYLRVYKAQIPEAEIAKAEAVEEPPQMKTTGFEANGEWKGGGSKSKLPPTKEALVEEAKKAMEAGKSGKQYTPSMTDPKELTRMSRNDTPQRGEDNTPDFNDPSDLPFIFTIPIALSLLMQFIA